MRAINSAAMQRPDRSWMAPFGPVSIAAGRQFAGTAPGWGSLPASTMIGNRLDIVVGPSQSTEIARQMYVDLQRLLDLLWLRT